MLSYKMRTDQTEEMYNYLGPGPNAPSGEFGMHHAASHASRPSSPVSPLNDPTPRPSLGSQDTQRTTTNIHSRGDIPPYVQYSSSTALQGPPPGSDEYTEAKWLPYNLRWPILSIPIVFSLALSVAISVLCWFSNSHYGLGKDDGSSILLFGWRFTPTLIVVLYCQLTVMIFDDVKRTEPYSRMARGGGANAPLTILQAQRSWWHTVFDGFSKKKNAGRRSWVLVCSSFVYIIGFLIVSPLSSSLLTAEDVVVVGSATFNRIVPADNHSLPLEINRDTYFRTIGNIIQDVPTSAWVSNDHFVFPFWPSDSGSLPLGPSLPGAGGTWETRGDIITTDFQCEPMRFVEKGVENVTYPATNYTDEHTEEVVWLHMASPSGCSFNMTPAEKMLLEGGLIWSNLSSLAMNSTTGHFNISAHCLDKELLIATTPWIKTKFDFRNLITQVDGPATFESNFTVHAEICTSHFHMGQASLTANILIGSASQIVIDENSYHQTKRVIPESFMDVKKIQNLTMNEDWVQYMSVPYKEIRRGLFNGVGSLVGMSYNHDLWAIVQAKDLSSRACKFKQRFLGELLYSSWFQTPIAELRTSTSQGQTRFTERRIVVVPEVGILMAVFFFLSSCLLGSTLWLARLKRRPLNLVVDPASPLGIASLVAPHREVLSRLRAFEHASKKDLQKGLRGRDYATHPGLLTEIKATSEDHTATQILTSTTNAEWRPLVLHLRTIFALVIFVLSLVVVLVLLKHFSDLARLYQTAFVYQTSFKVFNKKISTIAPYSIVPTIFAVGLGLWWDSLDKTFRSLQPYVSLSKRSRGIPGGAGLSYQSSYWAWAAFKAARYQHWLLFVITVGSTLSQVFIITMSALFNREPGNVFTIGTATRTLELRQVPKMDTVYLYPGITDKFMGAQVLSKLYSNLTTNWLNTATIQLTLNGPEPAWSRKGWSFVPVDISGMPNVTAQSLQRTGDDLDQDSNTHLSRANVTLTTPAIRARVECSSVPDISNTSAWLQHTNLTAEWSGEEGTYEFPGDRISFNNSGNPTDLHSAYVLKHQMFTYTPWNTSSLSHPEMVYCCANRTGSGVGESAVGYWSANIGNSYPYPTSGWTPYWPLNFTAKWIHGPARDDYRQVPNDYGTDQFAEKPGVLLFPEVPSMQAINCKPIIESAEATIVVDQATGHVHHYSILGDPVPATSAWLDNFIDVGIDTSDHNPHTNMTTSYGVLFFDSLLGAAQVSQLAGVGTHTYGMYAFWDEDQSLNDKAFNIRDTTQGLNLDFMSYAMYTMVNKDPKALLDYDTYLNLTQLTFSTYFQHYASSFSPLTETGWVYQNIGEMPSWNASHDYNTKTNKTELIARRYPVLDTNRTATLVVSNRIEVLRMNALATWLSVGILIWLALTTLLVAALQRTYLSSLTRNVESIADVLVMIAGSDNLLNLLESRGFEELSKDKKIVTRLGWFLDSRGEKRWGLEVVGGENPVTWINWHEDMLMSRMNTATTASSKLWEGLRARTKTFGL